MGFSFFPVSGGRRPPAGKKEIPINLVCERIQGPETYPDPRLRGFSEKKRGPMGDAGFFGGQVRLIRMEFLNEVSGPLSKMSNNMLVRSAKTTQSRVDTTWVLFCNLSFSLRRKQVFLGSVMKGLSISKVYPMARVC